MAGETARDWGFVPRTIIKELMVNQWWRRAGSQKPKDREILDSVRGAEREIELGNRQNG